MAQTRMERISSIFGRVAGMIKSGSFKYENRPLWYDIYEAFPPEQEPCLDRELKDTPVRSILYPEDNVRARYCHDFARKDTCSLFENVSESTIRSSSSPSSQQQPEQLSVQQQLVNRYRQLLLAELSSQTGVAAAPAADGGAVELDERLFEQAVTSLQADGVRLVPVATTAPPSVASTPSRRGRAPASDQDRTTPHLVHTSANDDSLVEGDSDERGVGEGSVAGDRRASAASNTNSSSTQFSAKQVLKSVMEDLHQDSKDKKSNSSS